MDDFAVVLEPDIFATVGAGYEHEVVIPDSGEAHDYRVKPVEMLVKSDESREQKSEPSLVNAVLKASFFKEW
jgi:hypothetical protein